MMIPWRKNWVESDPLPAAELLWFLPLLAYLHLDFHVHNRFQQGRLGLLKHIAEAHTGGGLERGF